MLAYSVKNSRKQDWVIAFCLFTLCLVTRIPFASNMIFEGDSARFALAMEQFDVAQMRPHAPGYILYVALAKLANLFIHDACVSLVGVSVVSSAFTVLLLYFLAKEMYGLANGIISSLLLVSCPLFWFNGEMPFTYSLEGLISVIFGLSCYKLLVGKRKWLLVSAVVLGLATGVRQNMFIMFLPLWLYAIRKEPIKHIVISVFVFGMTCLLWFIPMITLTGGLQKYFTALDAQFKTMVLHPSPFLSQIQVRGKILAGFVIYSLMLGIIPMIYFVGQLFQISKIVEDVRLKMICLWFFPAVLFFIGLNVFNPGHVVVILPALFICLAESVKGLAQDLDEGVKRTLRDRSSNFVVFLRRLFSQKMILVLSVILLLLVNVYTFLFDDNQVSYAAIERGERRLGELIRLTRENCEPDKSMILTFFYSTQAGYYLPDYLVYCPFPLMFSNSEVPIEAQEVYITFRHQTSPKFYWVPRGFKIEPITLPDGINTIVLWEEEIAKYYRQSGSPIKEITDNHAKARIYLIRVEPGQKIYYKYHYLCVK